jgi:hypothetical protein
MPLVRPGDLLGLIFVEEGMRLGFEGRSPYWPRAKPTNSKRALKD